MSQLNQKQMSQYKSLPTKSAQIRYLSSLKMSRGDISRLMKIRYQHVRNVLITPLKK